MEAARSIEGQWDRSRALAELAGRLAELGHPAKALEAAAGHWRRVGQVPVLAALAPYLGPTEREALAVLAPHLGPTERDRALGEARDGQDRALGEALEAARAIGYDELPALGAGRAGPAPGGARPPG